MDPLRSGAALGALAVGRSGKTSAGTRPSAPPAATGPQQQAISPAGQRRSWSAASSTAVRSGAARRVAAGGNLAGISERADAGAPNHPPTAHASTKTKIIQLRPAYLPKDQSFYCPIRPSFSASGIRRVPRIAAEDPQQLRDGTL